MYVEDGGGGGGGGGGARVTMYTLCLGRHGNISPHLCHPDLNTTI